MKELTRKIKIVFTDSNLRKRLLFVVFALVIFRLLANIPIPAAAGAGIDKLISDNQFLGFLNVLTGGGLSAISIVMLGVGPYITGSIIMQLLTMLSAKLKAMYQEEGETGRRKFIQYSRLLTIPLAFLQGWGLIFYLQSKGALPAHLDSFVYMTNVFIVAAGSIFLMWLGELVSEFGIGNGVSLIIFAGIVSSLPRKAGELLLALTPSDIPLYIGFLAAAFIIIMAIVIVTEAERPIPVTYAKQVRGNKVYGGVSTYLPLRLNQAGVIPIIFALSILIFPQALVNILAQVQNATIAGIASFLGGILSNTFFFSILYFLLVFVFTYFYTAITFDPESVATNLQKSGAFIPGVRPGTPTSDYLSKVLSRLTMVGAIFLGLVAVLPFAMIAVTGNQGFAIGGTAILIVVAVVLDLIKKVEAQITMREY